MDMFPNLPAGSFQVSEMRALTAGERGPILSYRITGPGPTGPAWSAYVVSVWVRRNGEWTTVYYQATAQPLPPGPAGSGTCRTRGRRRQT
jgi:hypothetical protein